MSVDPQKTRILLVEDSAMMRKIEVKTLRELGFAQIMEAGGGEEAVAILQGDNPVDLIISDWNMPGMDGYDLLVWVRGKEPFAAIPFLMATGQGDKQQEQKAVNAGVSSFVAKPFNAEDLQAKIDEAFGLKADSEASDAPPRERMGASGKVLLRVGHIQITDHLVLGVLKHLIQRGEMTPRHFELETECMGGWNPVQNALETGRVDAAFVLAPIAMDLFRHGTPLRLTLLAHRSGSIFVRNSRGDYSPPHENFFRNKSFCIPHKLSVHHMLAHLFFDRMGLQAALDGQNAKDVQFEVVAPVKMQDFLRENSDAAGFMVAEPLGTRAIASGDAHLQFLSAELWENHPCCVVAMRQDFIEPYTDAVYEFTDLLVQAGKFIARKPELAAEIGVGFLDPQKNLGLKVPVLKNVLTEPQGIKTDDLYPGQEDLDRMQCYMYEHLGIGPLVDMARFVDTRFADAACKDRISSAKPSLLHDADQTVADILVRSAFNDGGSTKAMLDKEGKYLAFTLARQEFGIDILKVREIVGMMPIRGIPQSSDHVRGVINLRDRVIPVIDLRRRFGLDQNDESERSCIIVLDLHDERGGRLGVTVDAVSRVMDLRGADIEEPPVFGDGIDTRYVLGMAKDGAGIRILLDVDHIFKDDALGGLAA